MAALHKKRDKCKFSDIYDKDHFVQRLQNDVRVVDKIPDFIMERFGHNLSNVFNFKIKAWAHIQYYKDVLPKLVEERFIRISPFANRLSFDAPSAVQRLRCLANFETLKFSKPIVSLSETLVHLRFEKDMIAFSCCVYDGGDEEKEMDAAREIGWRGKFTKRGPGNKTRSDQNEWKMSSYTFGAIRLQSFWHLERFTEQRRTWLLFLKCFLSYRQETLASEEELAPFKNFSSRMAAVDYSICAQSEVFVTTQWKFPAFPYGSQEILVWWKALKRCLLNMRAHSDAKGIEVKRPNESIYTFPCPDCMCRLNRTEQNTRNPNTVDSIS
ncbi:unnamed protein product [Miscanthus lutarioriparius]|uniref:O-fucosyltransferase family protein n=1 Tax=Miscanthus lutarioriparius TaxID=422564 RepID=A0A811RPJ4_9POAL|nr:unnamed protein product [Miscanthus lutarioriparius]